VRDWTTYLRDNLSLPAMQGNRDERAIREMADHLEDLTRDALARGMTEKEAEELAMRWLGDPTTATSEILSAEPGRLGALASRWLDHHEYEMRIRGGARRLFAGVLRDLRFALRSMRRNPLFAVTATLSLAVGVAANTIGFGFLYGYLIRPLPYTDGSRLVSVLAAVPSRGQDRTGVTLQDLRGVQGLTGTFDAVAATTVATVNLTGVDEPRRLEASVISVHLLNLVGIRPILGRLFTADDERGASGPVVLLSEPLWRSTFGGDAAAVGRTITLDQKSHTVIGVLPASPAWNPWGQLSLPIDRDLLAQPSDRRYRFVAHLAAGVPIGRANQDLEALSASLAQSYAADNTGVKLFAEDLRTDLLDDNREPALVLYGVVSLILLLACANVATLLVMRSASRSGELGIRASLGASRFQIGRQLFVEHAVITSAGAALGAGVGVWLRNVLEATLNPTPGPFRFDLDTPGVFLLALIVLSCTFAFGFLSAWSVTRQVFTAPKRAVSDRSRVRAGLAIFEVAIAVLVLVCTGLVVKGALGIALQPPGFDSHNVLTMEINLPYGDRDHPRVVAFFRDLVDSIRAMPQVESVSAGNPPPYIGWNVTYEAEGVPAPPSGQRPRTMDAVIMPGYFRTLRIPIVEGRDFDQRDTDETSAPVIVVSQSFARATWPGESAVGRRVRLIRREGGTAPWREVVGVVGDVRTSTFAPPRGWVYVPQGQPVFSELVLMIRFRGNYESLVRNVQRLVWRSEPTLPLHWNRLLDDLIAERYWQPRVYPRLFSVFSALALAVALVGVYGVVAYVSVRRTREFGIRMAIGSPPSKVWQLVVRQGLRLAAAGTAFGILAAFGLVRLASALLFGVSPTDAWVYVSCGVIAVAAVLVASSVPAFRAARIDPWAILRYE
jgi:putative ABC transport system permease protein